jgi:HlyD family secretion protein
MRHSVETAEFALAQSKANLAREEDLFKRQLETRQNYENAQTDTQTKQAMVNQAKQSLKTQDLRIQQQQAILDSAKYDLTKVRIVAPLDGIITRRNILEGEVVVMGTMNNAGTVLLTVADMSVIQAEVQVDETDIPNVKIGQPAKITIDALPDQTFTGKVTEVGNSPIQATGAASTTRATDFLVKVMLDSAIPSVRPGFSCTAIITTATRQQSIAVPIQATTVREMTIDGSGNIVREPAPARGQAPKRPTPADQELKPGQSRKEIEGVFVVKDNHAWFTPIKTGIAGDKYFETLNGLASGDLVITGPFNSVRTLKDGDEVKTTVTNSAAATVVK